MEGMKRSMPLPRHRRTRSDSKDRAHFGSSNINLLSMRRPRKTSLCAFAGGALLAVFVWGRLQVFGVRGPWSRAVRHVRRRDGDESLEWLNARRGYLMEQLTIADSRLTEMNAKVTGEHVHIDPQHHRASFLGQVIGASGDLSARAALQGGAGARKRTGAGFDAGGGEGADGNRVEAKGHFILGLSTEEFGATPVDQMFANYDTQSCDKSFGNGLIDAWRDAGTDCCNSGGAGGANNDVFEVLLAGVEDWHPVIMPSVENLEHHHGTGDNLVRMTNVQVDLSVFKDPDVTQAVMQMYKNSKHGDQPYVHLPQGAVKGACTPDATFWREQNFPGWNADWTTKAFQTVDGLHCDEWVEHPVMIVQRDTFANLFHDSEDFFNAVLAMAILRLRPGDVQLFLTDLYPEGPFWPMWDKVFGVGRPTLTSWEIGHRYGDRNVCFRDLTVGIFGPAAPTTLARMVTPCFHTALVRGYSDFVIRGLGLQERTRYASPPTKRVVVTWMARRSSVQWPERAFCSEDGIGSFFTCDYFDHLTVRELQRRVKNENEVIRSLRSLEREAFPNGAVVEIRDVDYNLLSFEEQILNDLETDVMIGPHGAGLFHIIFTPDRAALIELQIERTRDRKHFNNLALWSGHSYASQGGRNPVDVERTTKMVREAISGMDLSMH